MKCSLILILAGALAGSCSYSQSAARQALEAPVQISDLVDVTTQEDGEAIATQPAQTWSPDLWMNVTFVDGCGSMANMINVGDQNQFIRYIESQGYHVERTKSGGCLNHPLYDELIITPDGKSLEGQPTDLTVYSFRYKGTQIPNLDFSFRLVYSAEPTLNAKIERAINGAEQARKAAKAR